MKTLILMSILVLAGCGEQAESQATEIQRKMQEKADAHDEHAGHGHAHGEPCDHDHHH